MTSRALTYESPDFRLAALGAVGAAALGLVAGAGMDMATAAICIALAPILIWVQPGVLLIVLAMTCGLNFAVIQRPVNVSLPQVTAILLASAVFLRPRKDGQTTQKTLWAWGGFLFVVSTLPSMARPVAPGAAASGLIQFLVAGLILYTATDWLRTRPGMLVLVVHALLLGATISVLPAVVQVMLHIGPEEHSVGGVMRAYGTYGHPNNYGNYLVGVAPIAAALMTKNRWYALPLAVIVIGIVLTGSRGALVALAASLVMLWLLTARLKASTVLLGFLGFALLVSAPLWLPEQVVSRFTMSSWSSQQRLLLILMALQGIRANPVFGYGSGSFEALVPEIALAGYADDVQHPHNVVLHVWMELGLAATIVLALLLAAYYWTSIRAYRKDPDPLVAGLVGGVTGMFAAAAFGTLLVRGLSETFVLLIALTGAALLKGGTRSRAEANG